MGEKTTALARAIAAHGTCDNEDIARLRALSMEERGRLIEAACEAAVVIRRGRLAAGLPDAPPAPWPESTWEFLREHAARVRG